MGFETNFPLAMMKDHCHSLATHVTAGEILEITAEKRGNLT